jgi:biopolymer transport protein ExbD
MSGISFRKPRARKQVDLNVTSLVDVLFLLLIFFTLTSTFKRAGEIELQLPKSTTGEHTASGTGNQPVDLVLTENGTLLLDGSPTTFDALPPRLRSVHDRQPDRQVMIEAEERVGHGQVVRLLDAVCTAGFTGVGIGVRTAETAPAKRSRPRSPNP